jgi:hypothetical protein
MLLRFSALTVAGQWRILTALPITRWKKTYMTEAGKVKGFGNCVMVQFGQTQEPSSRIPVSERAFYQRTSRGEGPCVLLKVAKQKVSPGYSPADDNAGSLTPVEMTLVNGLGKREEFNCTTTVIA